MVANRWVALAAALALFCVGSPGRGLAFHRGGVGYCEGCHGLHPRGSEKTAGARLLIGADPSSTCLRCHAATGGPEGVLSADGSAYVPGGDFHWLRRTFSWVEAGVGYRSEGDRHGHNVVAAEFGLARDGRLAAAPGGTYPSATLGCESCHDPHGRTVSAANARASRLPIAASGSYGRAAAAETQVGTYRLLRGSEVSGWTDPPVAAAPRVDGQETDENHAAYGAGMSEWCGNCHAGLLAGAAEGAMHPAGVSAKLGAETAAAYNAYVRTGELSGSREHAYLALVPFETGDADPGALDPSSRAGPAAGRANVMCLTCHRAHASAFESIGRWDFGATFLADSHPQTTDAGARPDDARHAYYGRDVASVFGRNQRQLCGKCHTRD